MEPNHPKQPPIRSITSMLNRPSSPSPNSHQYHPNGSQYPPPYSTPSQYPPYPYHFPPPHFHQQYNWYGAPHYEHPRNDMASTSPNFSSQSNVPAPFDKISESGSPTSRGQQKSPEKRLINIMDEAFVDEEASPKENEEASSGEKGKKKRNVFSEEDDLRLIGAWLNNGLDSINGNSKGESYWKNVARVYNDTAPKDENRTPKQLKDRWSKCNQMVVKFHSCWVESKRTLGSEATDIDLIENAKLLYKQKGPTSKSFTLLYWWQEVKDHHKWNTAYNQEPNKRNKLCEIGSYTSSKEDNGVDKDEVEEVRPQKLKAIKAKGVDKDEVEEVRPQKLKAIKAKEKGLTMSSSNQTTATASKELESMKAKMCEVELEISRNKRAGKEALAKAQLFKEYKEMMLLDRSNFTPEQQEIYHEGLKYLKSQLGF